MPVIRAGARGVRGAHLLQLRPLRCRLLLLALLRRRHLVVKQPRRCHHLGGRSKTYDKDGYYDVLKCFAYLTDSSTGETWVVGYVRM